MDADHGEQRLIWESASGKPTTRPSWPSRILSHLIPNVTEWTLKRHAGAYGWLTAVGATCGMIGFCSIKPVTRPSGADQAAVTLGRTDGEIAGFTISKPPSSPGCPA